MRCAYFDCFGGVAGDMTLAALIDAGWPLAELQQVVECLHLSGVTVSAERVQRGGLAAMHVDVRIADDPARKHRHLSDIIRIIQDAKLNDAVADRAIQIFTRLAEAEAKVHGIEVSKVHFHEVGADDAIADIVGACAGLTALNIEHIVCSPIPTGRGTIECEHGTMPIPAPATAELLRGVPLAECDEEFEVTTPTGAAIHTTLAAEFGSLPPMQIEQIAYGAGTREHRTRANILRLFIGKLESATSDAQETAVVIEAQVDDAPGQVVAYAAERLLDAGALDVFMVPIIMKKGRPGQLITVLAAPLDTPRLEQVLLRETTTLGVRRHTCQRTMLERTSVAVETRFGPIRIKVGWQSGRACQAWPEYEDCAAAARSHDVALRDVQDAALRAWTEHAASQSNRGDG